jgi:endoribonuclease LACTB2
LSHWHPDHVGGVKDLLKVSPSTKVYKNEPWEDMTNIEDGDRFSVEGATLQAFHTPGHASDHMVLVLEEENAMFTADNVLGHGTAVFEDLELYLDSLDRMRAVFSGRAYPGHGPVIEDGRAKIAEYIQHRQVRQDQIMGVLRSRKDNGGPNGVPYGDKGDEWWGSMEVVKVIYKDVPESLHQPAERGVQQVLAKLENEGVLVEDRKAGKWRIKEQASL